MGLVYVNNQITWDKLGVSNPYTEDNKYAWFASYRWNGNKLCKVITNIVNIKSKHIKISNARSDAIKVGLKLRNKKFSFGTWIPTQNKSMHQFNTIFNTILQFDEVKQVLNIREEMALLSVDHMVIDFYKFSKDTVLDTNIFNPKDNTGFMSKDYTQKLNYVCDLISKIYQKVVEGIPNYYNLYDQTKYNRDEIINWLTEIERELERRKDVNNNQDDEYDSNDSY